MSIYEIIITCVAAANLALTIHALRNNAARTTAARVETIDRELREQLRSQADELQRLITLADGAVKHSDLADIYRELRSLAQSLHIHMGQQEHLQDTLRLMLAQVMRSREPQAAAG